jgi:hypothetical protein
MDQLVRESTALSKGFFLNFSLSGKPTPLMVLTASVLLGSSLPRIMRGKPDGLYLLGYLAIVLLWPFPSQADRLLWPVLPVLAAQALITSESLRARLADGSPMRRICQPALLLLLLLPGFEGALATAAKLIDARKQEVPAVNRYVDWYRFEPAEGLLSIEAQQAVVSGLTALTDEIPAKACVLSIKPDWVAYFTRRRSQLPPLPELSDEQFQQQLATTGCHYVLGLAMTDKNFPVSMYPLDRLQGHLQQLDAGGIYTGSPDPAKPGEIIGQTLFRLDELP